MNKRGTNRASISVVRSLFNKIAGKNLMKLSNKAGVPYSNVKAWRAGNHQPKIANFQALANAAGYDLALVPHQQWDTWEEWERNNESFARYATVHNLIECARNITRELISDPDIENAGIVAIHGDHMRKLISLLRELDETDQDNPGTSGSDDGCL